jgi:hypothetical protein
MNTRLKTILAKLLKIIGLEKLSTRLVPKDKLIPWYDKEHVGFCPFCGSCTFLPEDVAKGSKVAVRCGRRKDGKEPNRGCGRDLFA